MPVRFSPQSRTSVPPVPLVEDPSLRERDHSGQHAASEPGDRRDDCSAFPPVEATFRTRAVRRDSRYFVVWQDYRHGYDNADIYGARVTSAGGVSDAAGIPISTAADTQYYPTVAFNGTTYLVGWWDQRNGSGANGYKKDFYATRVTVGGTVLNPSGIPISTNLISGVDSPKVTASGTNFFALWRGGGVVYGARLSSTGTVQGTNGLPITFGPNAQWRPAVAFNGSNHFVVWQDVRPAGAGPGMYGARISRDGTVADPDGIAIKTGLPYEQLLPAVAATDREYLAVWMDTRHSLFGGIYDVYGARVGRDGQVLDPGGVPIALPHGGIYAYPRVASDGVGQFLVVSLSQRPSIPRVIGNFVGSSLVLRGLTTSDGAVTLWWDAVPGVMYRVQYKADLRDATWTDLPGEVTASGPTGNKVDETLGNAPRRFYRVVAL